MSNSLSEVAPAFVEMAHRIVWASVATVDVAPEPVGYDPAIIPFWSDGPLSPAFAALRLEPWRIRVQPAAVMLAGAADQLRDWQAG